MSGMAWPAGQRVWFFPCAVHWWDHTSRCIPLWAPQFRKDTEVLEWVQRRVIVLGKGLEHRCCEEQLRVFSLDEVQASFITLHTSLKGDEPRWGSGSFPRQPLIGQEDIVLHYARVSFDWALEGISLQRGWLKMGTGCPGWCCCHYL